MRMFSFLNISKNYVLNEPVNEVINRFDDIVAHSNASRKYAIYATSISHNPTEYVFRLKGTSLTRKSFSAFASTRAYTTLSEENNKTQVQLRTTTNPVFIMGIIGFILAFIVKLFFMKSWGEIELLAGFLLGIVALLVLDRFSKKLLISNFERELRNPTINRK